jgi:protein TonB
LEEPVPEPAPEEPIVEPVPEPVPEEPIVEPVPEPVPEEPIVEPVPSIETSKVYNGVTYIKPAAVKKDKFAEQELDPVNIPMWKSTGEEQNENIYKMNVIDMLNN